MKNKPKVAVIGAGFAGMTAAALLAREGYAVDVLEKNAHPGGRCTLWEKDGFRFDMGPSWYWMPDVFERFFERMGTSTAELLDLQRLDPSYRVIFTDDQWDIPAAYADYVELISRYEEDAEQKLNRFLSAAQQKYEIGMRDLVYKSSLSWSEYLNPTTLKGALRLNLFGSFQKLVHRHFKNPKVRELMEFPVLFLGAKPEKTPALYSLMNYADIRLGTWYPMGGMHELAKAFEQVAQTAGVRFLYRKPVLQILTAGKQATGLRLEDETRHYDLIISGSDYEHTEQQLLSGQRNYSSEYWDQRQMSPSSLLFFLGIKGRIPELRHHNLFFDADFRQHAREIYDTPEFPSDPLFYLCAPSVTDESVAPPDHENLFVLIPVAPDLDDGTEQHQHYLDLVLQRIEQHTGTALRDRIVVHRSFGVRDFKDMYHAYKGNAYGLANTLRQTGPWRPKIINDKIVNLFYCGQLSVPGPGMPPAIISGTIVADYILDRQ